MVDSGASMHMVSKKDLDSAELETVRISESRATLGTANGRGNSACQKIGFIRDSDAS